MGFQPVDANTLAASQTELTVSGVLRIQGFGFEVQRFLVKSDGFHTMRVQNIELNGLSNPEKRGDEFG